MNYQKIRFNVLPWYEIEDNIDSGNPIIINLRCKNPDYISHTVTACGYTSSKMTVTYANSSNEFLHMNNHAYCWETTLSKK